MSAEPETDPNVHSDLPHAGIATEPTPITERPLPAGVYTGEQRKAILAKRPPKQSREKIE